MENKKRSLKKKLIAVGVTVVIILLLISSFFLRDILLRAGVTEYERNEILQVKEKYSSIMADIIAASQECGDYTITATRQGLFEKSLIEYDKNSQPVKEKCAESVDVLCHSYCYGIKLKDGIIYFNFNQSGTKQILYGKNIDFTEESGMVLENLGDGWAYVQPKDT